MYTYTGVLTWKMFRRNPRDGQEVFPVKSEMAGRGRGFYSAWYKLLVLSELLTVSMNWPHHF